MKTILCFLFGFYCQSTTSDIRAASPDAITWSGPSLFYGGDTIQFPVVLSAAASPIESIQFNIGQFPPDVFSYSITTSLFNKSINCNKTNCVISALNPSAQSLYPNSQIPRSSVVALITVKMKPQLTSNRINFSFSNAFESTPDSLYVVPSVPTMLSYKRKGNRAELN